MGERVRRLPACYYRLVGSRHRRRGAAAVLCTGLLQVCRSALRSHDVRHLEKLGEARLSATLFFRALILSLPG